MTPSVWRVQATILDAVLPIWTNPHMASSGIASSGIVTLILRKCTEETKPLPAAASRAAQRAELALDPAIVQQCVEMRLSEARVQEALRRVSSGSLQSGMQPYAGHGQSASPLMP